jgi:small subunit ribosomal protein S6
MRSYDVSLIFSPLLEEQKVNDIVQQLASFVQEKGGILGNQQIRGKRPLLAPINKHKEGYLVILSFTLATEQLSEFEKQCKEHQDIIRFLVAKQPKKSKKPQGKGIRKSPIPTAITAELRSELQQNAEPTTETIAATPEEKPERTTEEKINLHDIDEKLEEIFKEDK